MLGTHWAKDHTPPFARGTQVLNYHGGPVMSTGIQVQPIYWGQSWATDAQSKRTWLGTFYGGVGRSSYMATNTANDSSATFNKVSTSVTSLGANIDPSAAPGRAPSTSQVLAEVQKVVSAGAITPVANGYYPVYVDTKRGGAGYCAWHSWGDVVTQSGTTVTVQFGFFFNLDGDTGCDPNSGVTAYSQGVAALVNVSGHELSEVATDPHGSAWYDNSGNENADKCAWTFLGNVNFGTTSWKIQSNFANNSYNSSAGSPRGCVNGN